MNELALFAGAGGGLLASHLLGWTTVCAVEIEPFCRDVLVARQQDGCLPPFPIWDDVRTFDGRPWRGRVDVVSGGFPCQPFSTASRGRRVAEDLWPDMLRIIREVEPSAVLAENVAQEPIEKAAMDMRRVGYRVRVCQASAASLGAGHDRPRWWAVADADPKGEPRCAEHAQVAGVCCLAGLRWDDPRCALGSDDGLADRMDRLRALGNGQVPQVAAAVWEAMI